jgi:NitT/TauT family transport system permease protein
MAPDGAILPEIRHVRPRIDVATLRRLAGTIFWAALSIGLFAGFWEACWALGISDARLLPPPHVFRGNLVDQAKFFNTAQRWQIGVGAAAPPPAYEAC